MQERLAPLKYFSGLAQNIQATLNKKAGRSPFY